MAVSLNVLWSDAHVEAIECRYDEVRVRIVETFSRDAELLRFCGEVRARLRVVRDRNGRDIAIRPERDDDHNAIAVVVGAAFKSLVEADLVRAIRSSPQYVPELALVAECDGEIVGHVMVSWTGLCDGEVTHQIQHLSPLAVAPAYQRRGVGTSLVREVTTVARERGVPFVVLEGDPRYYGRLGFESSASYGITMNLPGWAPAEAAQILLLNGDSPSVRGHVVHPPAFAAFVDY